ncbi:maltose alpha-D-glucosyltransferase [candidate division KSB1 bacterium]|nr:maltose alpha-D-glucosyltransferase [candidate division KSB1 bacterium]
MSDSLNWYKEAIFYEIDPRTFFDSNGDGIGDLQGILQKLDYIKSLGANCIWLLPIFASPMKDGGYDIEDYYAIHPDLGTQADLSELIEAIHARDMRLILDLVVNHTSDQCEWFQKAAEDKDSPYYDYYVWSDTDEKYKDARIIFLDTEKSNWAWSEKAQQYYWHRFYSSQPDLNYDNPAVREEMKHIMRFWLDMGIDGFRADAVPYLFEREGTNCENLPETHAFLKEMRRLMDAEYPDRILLAEANQWPRDLMPYLANGDEFHMAFNFPVMPRIFKSIGIGDNSSLIETLKNTPKIPESCQWCTFLRNHDELTVEMVSEEDRKLLWDIYAPESRMRLNLGIRRRLAPLMDGDMHKVELLFAILFSLPGAAIIYYGDEIGMGDNIWLDDRDGVRTPMQWSDGMHAGFSSGGGKELYRPVIDEGKFNYKNVNVAQQINEKDSFLNRIKILVEKRKAHEIFAAQDYKVLNPTQREVFAIQRFNEHESILCLNNLTEKIQTVPLEKTTYHYLHSSSDQLNKGKKYTGEVILPPYSYLWLTEI